MNRWVILLLSLFLSPLLRAQGTIPLLDRAAGERVSFHYTYSLSRDGGAFDKVTDGEVTLEGNAYMLRGLGLEVISDGTTRWTLDHEAREVVVEHVEREDLFTNPALFIGAYKNYLDKLKVNSSGPDSLDITLTLDKDVKARFVLTGIVFSPLEGKSGFSLKGKPLSDDYLVTDLR